MSQETQEWLNENVLVGYTDKRSEGGWWRQDGYDNHVPGPIPVETVRNRLFNWKSETSPVYVEDGNGGFTQVPNKIAQLRSDSRAVMGIHSDGYTGHGFDEWLIGGPAAIVDTSEGELAIGSAGLLKGGAVAWVQIEMANTVETEQGFDFRPFLLATTSFDGTVATQYGRKVNVVVCDNTLEIAKAEKGQKFKLRHTKNSELQLANARDALKIIFAARDEFSAEVKTLTETSVSDAQWAAFLDAHCPVVDEKGFPKIGRGLTVAEHEREALSGLWLHDNRVSPWSGTALGVLQAVNTYSTHVATMRKVVRPERQQLNVISGKTGAADNKAMAQLATVLAA